MSPLKEFIGCTIKRDLDKMTLNIYQYHLITKTTQGFNNRVKSTMTSNTPSTSHRGVVRNQETGTNTSKDLRNRFISDAGSLM